MEVWRDIEGYEGLYQVSNYGRVKSLSRLIDRSGHPPRKTRERILRQQHNLAGYPTIIIYKNKKKTTFNTHRLVAIAFIDNPKSLREVNHLDKNPRNNHYSNLEWVTPRENSRHKNTTRKKSSIYPGVSITNNKNKKWRADIQVNGSPNFLGYFKNQIEAFNAYQNALRKINEDSNRYLMV